MGNFLYYAVRTGLDWFYWGGELLGEENLPDEGPAVIVSNHLGPVGPIGAICSLPLRLYPWAISNMVDSEEAPEYLCKDFVEKTLKMKPPRSLAFARRLSRISVPLLTGIGCIPVYRKSEKIAITWQKSLDLLLDKQFIFVTPEYDKGIPDPETRMTSFMTGFVGLGEVYQRATGRRLDFYPVAVHGSRRVRVGQPFAFDPCNPLPDERRRLSGLLEQSIAGTYLQLGGGNLREQVPDWLRR